MPIHNIVIGQKVKPELVQRAKEFRRQMTPEEKMLWQHLRANRLGGFHFRRQQIIDGYLVDFYCHAAALVVEVDGPVHEDEQQREHDEARDNTLSGRGFYIMRFKNEEIRHNLADVLARILACCRERTAKPT